MKINRQKIQRMIDTGALNVGVRRNAGSSGGGGGVSQQWVDENYISKEFFNSLFIAYDDDNEVIEPNDTDATVDNVQILGGVWTNSYVSSLKTGSGGRSATRGETRGASAGNDDRIAQLEEQLKALREEIETLKQK